MAKVLTAASVQKVRPDPEKRLEIPDAGLPGLYLLVQPSGRKSWAIRYRHNGTPRKFTLSPSYPALDLKDARAGARAAIQDIAEGGDPAKDKRRRREHSSPDPDRDLFENVAAEFLRRHVGNSRWRPEVERLLNREILPDWRGRRVQDLTKRDIIALMDRQRDRGLTTQVNRTFAVARKLLNWCVERDIIDASPCQGLRPPVPEVSRDRVLGDAEIRWFWKAADGLGYPFGSIVQLLLLTGQRKSEVGDAVWAELDLADRLWTIPKERAKNNRPHDVPLPGQALTVLKAIPRIAGTAGYLFTTTGRTAVSGFSRAKNNLDAAMLRIAREEAEEVGDPDAVSIGAWRLHDLRRTTANGMAKLGIALPTIEKLLNHTSGSFGGIVSVYQRHSHADEKRTALAAWGRKIESIVSDQPADNVVDLRTADA